MLTFRFLNSRQPDDVAALFELLAQAPQYSIVVKGRLPLLQDAFESLTKTPPGKEQNDKFFAGFRQEGALVGCMDLIRGYPEPDIAFLGLLLFAEAYQNQGLGVQALTHVATLARSWGCTVLRLGVIDTNKRALSFWQREGFKELSRKPTSDFTGDIIVMQRAFSPLANRLEKPGICKTGKQAKRLNT